jgi:hypothetical protein
MLCRSVDSRVAGVSGRSLRCVISGFPAGLSATHAGFVAGGCGLSGGTPGKRSGCEALLVPGVPRVFLSCCDVARYWCHHPQAWPVSLSGAGIVAVRVADLASPLRRPLREGTGPR